MIEWLNMDGDGIYVWPCYALTLLVLIANVWVAKSQHASLLKRVAARARHDEVRTEKLEELHHDAPS